MAAPPPDTLAACLAAVRDANPTSALREDWAVIGADGVDDAAACRALPGVSLVAADDEQAEPSASSLIDLQLDGAGLTEFPALALGPALAGRLRSLSLASNGLQAFPSGGGDNAAAAALARCSAALESLLLGGNILRALPPEVGLLRQLKKVVLAGNPLLSELPLELFTLPRLEWLDASECRLERLPEGACGALAAAGAPLSRLDLYGNRLKAVPKDMGLLMPRLRHLSLHSNALEELPEGAFGGAADGGGGGCAAPPPPALEWLSLNCNRLRSVPATIGRCAKLSRLSLHINDLESLPDSLGDCSNLEALSLHKNPRLGAIPASLGRLKRCTRLSLYECALRSLPPEIGGMASLQELWLYDTRLSSLPEEIGACTALRRLWLDRNPALASVPGEALGGLPHLQELYLDNCPSLRRVPAELARLAPTLRRLYLDADGGAEVPEEVRRLPALVAAREYDEAAAAPPPVARATALDAEAFKLEQARRVEQRGW